MRNNLYFTTVFEANKFERYPDPKDEKNEDLFLHNPELWWNLSIVWDNEKQMYEDISHENVAKNTLALEEWIAETYDYTIVVTPYINKDTVKTSTTKRVKVKSKSWLKKAIYEEVEVVTNVHVRTPQWRFWFRDVSDAVLFSTAWKGEES